jgi:hypothetical protein
MNIVACLVYVMIKGRMFFIMASVALCLESGLIYCDCNNILGVPAEAISMAVCVFFLLFLSKIIKKNKKPQQFFYQKDFGPERKYSCRYATHLFFICDVTLSH